MEWDKVRESFPADVVENLRHDFGRKINDPRDTNGSVELSKATIDAVGVFRAPDDFDCMDDLPSEFAGGMFVLEYKGELFAVNTEGYGYCRYVARIGVL